MSHDQKRDWPAHFDKLKKRTPILMAGHPQYCTFCGAKADEVILLIAGPTVFICDGCVALCMSIVAKTDPELFEEAVVEARSYANAAREGEPPRGPEPRLSS